MVFISLASVVNVLSVSELLMLPLAIMYFMSPMTLVFVRNGTTMNPLVWADTNKAPFSRKSVEKIHLKYEIIQRAVGWERAKQL